LKKSTFIKKLEHGTNFRQIQELLGYESSKRNSEAGSSGYNDLPEAGSSGYNTHPNLEGYTHFLTESKENIYALVRMYKR